MDKKGRRRCGGFGLASGRTPPSSSAARHRTSSSRGCASNKMGELRMSRWGRKTGKRLGPRVPSGIDARDRNLGLRWRTPQGDARRCRRPVAVARGVRTGRQQRTRRSLQRACMLCSMSRTNLLAVRLIYLLDGSGFVPKPLALHRSFEVLPASSRLRSPGPRRGRPFPDTPPRSKPTHSTTSVRPSIRFATLNCSPFSALVRISAALSAEGT